MATILVIDDDGVNRMVMRLHLERIGHNVLEATTGVEGEQSFQSRHIDMVFTDIFMPEQDGLQTIINIRKINRDIPIVAMSAGGMMNELDYLNHSKILGATHAVRKPIGADAINDIVTSACI